MVQSRSSTKRKRAPLQADPLILDSVTALGAEARGRVALAASHGGRYAGYVAAKAGIAAVILCDAGIGRERAGVAGIDDLARLEVPAAAIGHRSARIGDGEDCARRGLVSYANAPALASGVAVGMPARAALARLAAARPAPSPAPEPLQETRHRIADAEAAGICVFALDSNSLVTAADSGHIVLSGSHGGLLGGRPETAVKHPVFAAVYNDADFGADAAGISRLPALDARGIAGATVSAWSARIGDGLSTYRDGFVTAVNRKAAACGAIIGISARELVRLFVAARAKELST